MSVLSNIVDEREGWAARHRVAVVHHSPARTILEHALLITIGLLVYNHYDKILDLIKLLH